MQQRASFLELLGLVRPTAGEAQGRAEDSAALARRARARRRDSEQLRRGHKPDARQLFDRLAPLLYRWEDGPDGLVRVRTDFRNGVVL